MIAWTIQAAIETSLFSRILVSTDDTDIAEIALKHGAEVPFYRTFHTDDHSTISEATIGALRQATDHWHEEYTAVVQLMANCPLRTAKDISKAIESFDRKNRSFQISCFKFGWMNPWWAAEINNSGTPKKLFPHTGITRSQDLPDLYCPTGAIWIAKTQKLLQAGSFYGPGHHYEPMAWDHAVDIDDHNDLAFAIALSTAPPQP